MNIKLNTTKDVVQNYGLMKFVGYLYIALALAILAGGLWLSLTLVRADFYAEYRRGMHLVVGIGTFLVAALLALGFYVQGSMAAAVADIDTTTRRNGAAIEQTRRIGERAARSSQQAARNSDAMLHAHTALQSATSDPRTAPESAPPTPQPAAPADASDEPLAPPPQDATDTVVQSLFSRSRRLWRQPVPVAAEASTSPEFELAAPTNFITPAAPSEPDTFNESIEFTTPAPAYDEADVRG